MTLHNMTFFFFVAGTILFILAYLFKKKFVDGKGIGDTIIIWLIITGCGIASYVITLIGLITIAITTS